jgi:hypothetical protein
MHPEYPSAHSILASAVGAVLRAEIGSGSTPSLQTSSPSAKGATRRWSSVDEFVREVASARVYEGVHYRFSTTVGIEMGQKIGELALAPPTTSTDTGTTYLNSIGASPDISQALPGDVLMQTAVGSHQALASAPTLSRLDNRATRAQAWALHEVLLAQFIASHDHAPEELVLDIDASDVPLHGPAGTRCCLPRLLRRALLPAAVRVLRPGDAGVLPAAQQDRRGQACRGGDQAAGGTAAPGVA